MSSPAGSYDVVIVGGGIAGSILGGVLARDGFGVLVVEKEPRFRDRVRGESTWPYGVAHALAMGIGDLLERAGTVDLVGFRRYEERQAGEPYLWATDSIDGRPEIGFSHPSFQEAAFGWAAEQGATTLRPAKAVGFARNGRPEVTVARDGREETFAARLVVGADGKRSMARRWTGGASAEDPEHHRFGGVLVSGVRTDDRETDNVAGPPGFAVNWFAAGRDHTRLYLVMTADEVRRSGADRSFAAFVATAADHMPEGALAQACQAGPVGCFPNSDTWATRIAGNGVALVGDAAGAPDPSQGHGTAMLFRDARSLSELLLSERDWERAASAYAAGREAAFAAVREHDRWHLVLDMETGTEADRAREGHERAKQDDPTLGGWAVMEARGPDGLVPDEAARRRYFGEG